MRTRRIAGLGVAHLLWLIVSHLASAAENPEAWRVVAMGGDSFGGRAWEFSELGSAALARDIRLFSSSRLVGSGEAHPLIELRQRRLDRAGMEEHQATALAALLAYRGGSRSPGWSYRIEIGSGLFYSWNGAIPADGTRFNFFDQAGLSAVLSSADRRSFSLGYRFVHISNLNLFTRRRNAGTSFHTFVLSVSL